LLLKTSWPAGLASTLNQKSFAASLRSDRQKILSVSPRLLKDFKRWVLVTPKAFGVEPENPIAIGSDHYRIIPFIV
jgi:hypothetical protein